MMSVIKYLRVLSFFPAYRGAGEGECELWEGHEAGEREGGQT